MSKKKEQESWPTEEEFVKDDIECGLADDVTAGDETNCEDCGGDCSSCAGCCNESSEDLAQKYLSIAQSVQADFENYKKRNANLVAQSYEDGKKSVILSILPCADAIDKAIEMVKDEQTKAGLVLVSEKFAEALKSVGVVKMQCLGKPYDANFHNVLASIDSDKPSGEIIQECISGYMIGDIVLRHAQVVVSK